MIFVPTGGAVIDTHGMREVGIESVDLNKAFVDIDELAQLCRFKDCKHENEPDCAVRKAIENGSVEEERFLNYRKLKKEAKYEGLNAKQIEKEKTDHMYSGFDGQKNAKKFLKSKNKIQ